MRFLTTKQRLRLRRHAENSQESKLRWKEWRRIKHGGLPSLRVQMFKDGKRVLAEARGRIPMPRVFCLDQNTEETLAFLARIRTALLEQAVAYQQRTELQRQRDGFQMAQRKNASPQRFSIRSYIDFKSLRKITPTAALVLAALYDRRKAISGSKPFTIDEHLWDHDVLRVLRSVGFHELLEMRPEKEDDQSDQKSVRILKFVSGEQVASQELGALQDALVEFLPEDERERLLFAEPYAGMIEAALNSHMWAYPANHTWDFPSVPRWWMTGRSISGTERRQWLFMTKESRFQGVCPVGSTGQPSNVWQNGFSREPASRRHWKIPHMTVPPSALLSRLPDRGPASLSMARA
jgi:hypothetical protein